MNNERIELLMDMSLVLERMDKTNNKNLSQGQNKIYLELVKELNKMDGKVDISKKVSPSEN